MLIGQVWVGYSSHQVQLTIHLWSIHCMRNSRHQDPPVCKLPRGPLYTSAGWQSSLGPVCRAAWEPACFSPGHLRSWSLRSRGHVWVEDSQGCFATCLGPLWVSPQMGAAQCTGPSPFHRQPCIRVDWLQPPPQLTPALPMEPATASPATRTAS